MSTLSVRLPNSLHKQLRELAKREGVSMNQLISSAVGEKVAALMTVEYLQERAERGSRRKYQAALARVPDKEPEDLDKIPDRAIKRSGQRRR
jgi:predicted DNA-binding ribbon-helix-helix protein